ncbi:ISL3 family transposase [Candidatus Poriferisodalis sp.]|uniref:ISL3 family transposase n=1 Tax=Candidatus Poriferisodalis sp. TaxID=3101277 RepID=UPI003C6F6CEE
MASDVMRVRLHLRQLRVLSVLVDEVDELRVEVASTVRRPRCPGCGLGSAGVHDRRRREIRDLEVSGRSVTLVWLRRRFACWGCDRRWVEDHPEFEGRLTRRLARRLVSDAKAMPIRAVARRHRIGWEAVMTLVTAWSALVADHRRSRRSRVLLVDETSMRKRHRYVTVIMNGDSGETLAMVPHRSAAALSGFLAAQGPRWCKGVKVVVSDGSKAYRAAIDARLGHARHVLDRFHVIRWFSAGLTAVRRDIQRRRPPGVKPAFDREVFKARFALGRRGDQLNPADRARLEKLFDAHPRLRAGWAALQELHGLYLAEDEQGALEALDRFADLYATGELPEFSSVVDTVIAWSTEILAWHHTGRPSNGRIEGTNNLLQVLRRTAHGFTNPHNFAARGILTT